MAQKTTVSSKLKVNNFLAGLKTFDTPVIRKDKSNIIEKIIGSKEQVKNSQTATTEKKLTANSSSSNFKRPSQENLARHLDSEKVSSGSNHPSQLLSPSITGFTGN